MWLVETRQLTVLLAVRRASPVGLRLGQVALLAVALVTIARPPLLYPTRVQPAARALFRRWLFRRREAAQQTPAALRAVAEPHLFPMWLFQERAQASRAEEYEVMQEAQHPHRLH